MSGKPHEQVRMLGPARTMTAIVTTGPAVQASRKLPTIVLLNAGILHRVGPNRMNVRLARRFSELGFMAVRFDLSGLGDSEARLDSLSPLDAALTDMREALDSIASSDGDRFLLVGLCSGANLAAIYAAGDPRVAGVVLLDPYVPRTPSFYLIHYGRRMLRPRAWSNALRSPYAPWNVLRRRLAVSGTSEPVSGARGQGSSAEIHRFLEQRYQLLAARSVPLLVVLTSGGESQHNHRAQFRRAFSGVQFGGLLATEYFHGVDHLFTGFGDQLRLLSVIEHWLAIRFRAAGE